MKKRYYALIALITIPTVLGRLGVNPGGYAAPIPSSTIETPAPSSTPRPIVTPTTSPIPYSTPEPTPKAKLSPADIERSRRLLRDFTERKQNASPYGSYGTSSNGGPTYDGQNVEPSVREFGDSSGMSWVDQYTFRADGPTPNTWGDVQK